jgi:hypothetical protein
VSTLLARLVRFGRSRGQALGLAACVAAFARVGLPELPEPSVDGLSGMLGAASGVEVRPGELVWAPRGGVMGELVRGRPVLYLGARRDAPKDLYRARVRLTPRGQPIAVRAVENLTRTPLPLSSWPARVHPR